MNMLKLTAAAALVAASLSASAMTTIADDELSAVSGQDGVSIAASLNINIGSFTYTDTDGGGAALGAGTGSVSFNGIHIGGLMEVNIDILSGAQMANTLLGASAAYGGTVALGASYAGGDVVQFAFPADAVVPTAALGSISVDSIKMGGSTASFGKIAITGLDLRGTTVWMWAH